MSSAKVIKASGCVVFKREASSLEFLIIHRPRYDDWSIPKGKKNKKETDLECALREVEEETGAVGEILGELEPVRYRIGRGKEKIVRFWIMQYTSGQFKPNKEVDEIEWLPCESALEKLTYSHDTLLLNETMAKIS